MVVVRPHHWAGGRIQRRGNCKTGRVDSETMPTLDRVKKVKTSFEEALQLSFVFRLLRLAPTHCTPSFY